MTVYDIYDSRTILASYPSAAMTSCQYAVNQPSAPKAASAASHAWPSRPSEMSENGSQNEKISHFFFSHKPAITSPWYHHGTTSSYTNGGWKLTVHPAPQKRWHRWSWPWWPADTSIVQRTQKLCGRWSSQIGLKWVEHKCLKPPPIVL